MLKHLEKKGRNALRTLLVPLAIRALRRQATAARTPSAIVELALNFRHLGLKIAPSQIPIEITQLLTLMAQRSPKLVLEIGTHKGGTFFMFTRVAAPDALLISLDLPPGRVNSSTGGFDVGYASWQGRLFRSFAREQQRVVLVQADSHQPGTVEKIRQVLAGRPLDFLLIDGDHSYEGVKEDFAMYSPLVHSAGLIAFHDIVPGPEARVGGVPQFWKEIKETRKVTEFVADWNQGAYGIGVIDLSEKSADH